MDSEKKVLPFLKKYATVIVAGILLLSMLFGGGYGYKYHKEQLKPLDSLKKVLQKRDIEESVKIQEAIDSIFELNIQEKSYYNEYVAQYNKVKRLEKKLADISNLIFDKHYLDSLADNIQYREP